MHIACSAIAHAHAKKTPVVYMYTCSFIIVHILPPFLDLYIIHYVFIAYSTLNFVSFVYIYIFINLTADSTVSAFWASSVQC